MTTERAAAFYCPYCGEEDIRPREEPQSAWLCSSCRRVFTVTFVGLSFDMEEQAAPDQSMEASR
jgi:ribosomal protein L37AE/L43A